MKIAFYFPNSGLEDVDLSNPEIGNPGIGGTHFHLLAIPYYLSKYSSQCLLFAQKIDNLPPDLNKVICLDQNDAIVKAKENSINYLVIWSPSKSVLELAQKHNVNLVVYGQNFIWERNLLDKLSENPNVKAFVAVGNEMVDFIRDHPIIKKTRVINNAIHHDYLGKFIQSKEKDKNVCYVGSLIPEKGFHILASVWKDITRKCPNAKLHIIGSGQLYDRNVKLGKYNLATEEYENQFIPCLSVNDEIMDNVYFHGHLANEKWHIMERSMVGVPNPSGLTETFCITGVEFQALGVPVVTTAEFGFLDTIKNGVTGHLVKSREDLIKKIILQLSNSKINLNFSQNARLFSKKFDFQIAVKNWQNLFDDLYNGSNLNIVKMKSNFFYKKKYMKEIIRIFGLSGKNELIKDKGYVVLFKMLLKKLKR
jgi:glycosyltransferase involved in cell wall biosynthesis